MEKAQMKKHVDIFTDGACSNNPGPGGWAAILRYNGEEKELSGGEHETTNNRMELTAAIQALKALRYSCDVTLYSDSRYLVDAMEKGWALSWKKRGWKRSSGEPAQNKDLFEELLKLTEVHNVKFVWVKGHEDHPENIRCDKLAVARCNEFKL